MLGADGTLPKEYAVSAPKKQAMTKETMDRQVLGVDLSGIRNSNEVRVAGLLPLALENFPGYEPDSMDLEDIYALTLNRLPPRYRQRGTIQLSGKLPDEDILWELGNAIRKVRENPTRP